MILIFKTKGNHNDLSKTKSAGRLLSNTDKVKINLHSNRKGRKTKMFC